MELIRKPSVVDTSRPSIGNQLPLSQVVAILSPQLPEQHKLKCHRMLHSLGARIVSSGCHASQLDHEFDSVTHVITLASGSSQFKFEDNKYRDKSSTIKSSNGSSTANKNSVKLNPPTNPEGASGKPTNNKQAQKTITTSPEISDTESVHNELNDSNSVPQSNTTIRIPPVAHLVTPLWVFQCHASCTLVNESLYSANPIHIFSGLVFKFAKEQVNHNEQNLLSDLITHYGGEVVDALTSHCTHLLVMRDEGDECYEAAKLRTAAEYDVYGVRIQYPNPSRANASAADTFTSFPNENEPVSMTPKLRDATLPTGPSAKAAISIGDENTKQQIVLSAKKSRARGGNHYSEKRVNQTRSGTFQLKNRFKNELEMVARKEYLALEDAVITLSFAWIHACIAAREYLPEAEFEFESYNNAGRATRMTTVTPRQKSLFKSALSRGGNGPAATHSLSPVSMFPALGRTPVSTVKIQQRLFRADSGTKTPNRSEREDHAEYGAYFDKCPLKPFSTLLRGHVMRFCSSIPAERLARAHDMAGHLGAKILGCDVSESEILAVVSGKKTTTSCVEQRKPGELHFDVTDSRYYPVITISVYNCGAEFELAKSRNGVIASLCWLDALHSSFVTGGDPFSKVPLASTSGVAPQLRDFEKNKVAKVMSDPDFVANQPNCQPIGTPMFRQLFPSLVQQFHVLDSFAFANSKNFEARAGSKCADVVPNVLVLLGDRSDGFSNPPPVSKPSKPVENGSQYLDLLWYPQPRRPIGVRSMHDVVVSVTGFSSSTWPSRVALRLAVETCGGCCLGPMSRERTSHLICRDSNNKGMKYTRAAEWGIYIINSCWIFECMRNQKHVQEHSFRSLGPQFDFSTSNPAWSWTNKIGTKRCASASLLFDKCDKDSSVVKSPRVGAGEDSLNMGTATEQGQISAFKPHASGVPNSTVENPEGCATVHPLTELGKHDDNSRSVHRNLIDDRPKLSVTDALSSLDIDTRVGTNGNIVSSGTKRNSAKRLFAGTTAATPAKAPRRANEGPGKSRLDSSSPLSSRVFMLGSSNIYEVTRWEKIILHLGGYVQTTEGDDTSHGTCDGHQFNTRCTHLIVSQARVTEKLASALAAGKWVLPGQYLEACLNAERFLSESEYLNNVSEIPETFGVDIARSVLHWRSAGGRTFHGGHYVLLGLTEAETAEYKTGTSGINGQAVLRIIRAGGGEGTVVSQSISHMLEPGTDRLSQLVTNLGLQNEPNRHIACVVPQEFHTKVSMVAPVTRRIRRSSRSRTQSSSGAGKQSNSIASRMKQLIASSRVVLMTYEDLFASVLSPRIKP